MQPEELSPYLLYRITGDQLECALWQLEDGRKALALFLSGDQATAYHQATHLGEEWKMLRPERRDLLEIIRTAYHSGVQLAVLDPDSTKAKRIFDLQDIINLTDLP